MTAGWLALLLFAVGVVLLFGELLLPTAGVLGILGGLAVLASVGVCFYIDQWLGLGAFVALLVISPLVGTWVLNLWPKTAFGKRVILQPVEAQARQLGIEIGQTGTAITELRPGGECEFDDRRVEAIAEHGIIPRGKKVRVVGMANARPMVRAMEA